MVFVDQIAQYYQKHIRAKIKIRILFVICVIVLFAPLFISVVLPIANRYLLNRRISDLEKQSVTLASEKEKVKEKERSVEYLSNEILIKVEDKVKSKIKSKPTPTNTGILSLNKLNKANKVRKFQKINSPSKKSKIKNHEIFNWYKITLLGKKETITEKLTENDDKLNSDNAAAQKLKKSIAKFHADPNIEAAEPNYVVNTTVIPNDPYYSSSGSWGQAYQDLYGMHKINAATAWDQTTDSTGIIVANIDTGVDRNHEDLQGNMWVNSAEIPGNEIDDDGNGYTDDYYGWDWYNNDNNPMDDNGHGTHTTGTIAAEGNNGIGVVGVNWVGKIMALKFLNSSGTGYTAHAASALRYAADMGAKISSNSWGCRCYSSVVADAVSYEHDVGMAIVASAGNDQVDVMAYSPASLKEVITVAGSDADDSKYYYTNFGIKVDVAAPGNDVLSLKSAVSPMCSSYYIVGANYCRASGTSMAAPHVSGLAALILDKHPEFSNEEVRQAIRVSADDIGDSGFDIYSGHGRINAGKALAVNSVLTASFVDPFTEDLSDLPSVEIRGTAAGTGFVNYELSYGEGAFPSSWTSINSSSNPVTNGVLGNWQVGAFEPGRYTVKLVVTDSSGSSYDVYRPVFKEKWVSLLKRNNGDQMSPAISGQKIVWRDTRYDNGDIYLYDLSTNTERRITPDSSGQFSPDIWGDKIVWFDDRDGPFDIFMYDLTTNTERQITDEAAKQASPRIFGDKIVWHDLRDGSDYQIYLYDLATNTERQITNEDESQTDPSIYGDKIIWEGYHRPGSKLQIDIFMYDLSTNTQNQLTNDATTHQYKPDIWGDKVVWWEKEFFNPTQATLALYDLTSDTKQEILTDVPAPYGSQLVRPRIYENTIVWSDLRNGNYDIAMYDIATGTEKSITSQWQDQTDPAVFGEHIIWTDYRDSSYGAEIYRYNSPDSITPTVAITSPTNGSTVSGSVNVAAEATDNVGVTKVEFSVDGVLKNTDTTEPYDFTWDSTSVSIGTHSILAKAYDAVGNFSSDTVTVTVARDTDGDGYTDDLENFMGTDPNKACPATSTRNDEDPDAWPPDFDDNRVINILDVNEVLPPYFGSTVGDPNYSPRRDLDANGVINMLDVNMVLPPVFGSSCSSGANEPDESDAAEATAPSSAPKRKQGDLNNDTIVNIRDLSVLVSKWGGRRTVADINGDGRVNIRDLSILLSRWGR